MESKIKQSFFRNNKGNKIWQLKVFLQNLEIKQYCRTDNHLFISQLFLSSTSEILLNILLQILLNYLMQQLQVLVNQN